MSGVVEVYAHEHSLMAWIYPSKTTIFTFDLIELAYLIGLSRVSIRMIYTKE